MGLLLAFLRYLFLFLLYSFLVYLCWLMFRELSAETKGALSKGKFLGIKVPRTSPGAKPVFLLLTLLSSDPRLEAGTSFLFRDEVAIGRGKENDLVVNDPFVSLRHAKIFKQNGQFWLADLNSRNGTYLNRVKVASPVVITNGDRLRVGGAVFQFVRWTDEVESGN